MREPHIKVMLAGLFFAMWPLFMNRSGLNPSVASAVFIISSFVVVLPFALYGMVGMDWNVRWQFGVIAGVFGAVGVIFFNSVLSKVTPKDVGALFTLLLVTQIVVAAAYQTYMSGGLTVPKAIGFIGAIMVAILLA